jgi:uncharacterized protein (TIGR03083 family)
MLSGADVLSTAADCARALGPATDRSWDVPVPDLDWTVAETVAHMAEGCLWYAIDLAAAGVDLEPVEHRVVSESAPQDLVATFRTYARVAAHVIDATPPETRGYHPWGAADPAGFAAMSCDELLVHTDDAARGLGLDFAPDREICERVLRRLFPWAPQDGDPWEVLRWANGRVALPDHPRLEGWGWHCAPLEEWDGRSRIGDRSA